MKGINVEWDISRDLPEDNVIKSERKGYNLYVSDDHISIISAAKSGTEQRSYYFGFKRNEIRTFQASRVLVGYGGYIGSNAERRKSADFILRTQGNGFGENVL